MQTKNGHDVAVIVGDADGIRDRGREIEDLGEQMIGASEVLREIGDGATEEKGRSIEKIQKEVGDVHEELKLAGDRYKPTGTAMKQYGITLASVQSAMRRIVRDAEEAKEQLDARKAAAATALSTAEALPEPDQDDATATTAKADADENATTAVNAVGPAKEAYDAQLELFDTAWDTWDEAYDAALTAINEATEGNVTDDWTDNFAGIVEVVLEVLTWVGLVLTIAALIVGGPIIAAIAAVVGIIALIGTLYLFAKGRRGKGDVGWAIIGVLPFGKLAKVFQKGKRLQGLAEFAKGPYTELVTPFRRIRSLSGLANNAAGFRSAGGLGRNAANGLAARFGSDFSNFTSASPRNILTRITSGSGRPYAEAMAENFNRLSPHHQRAVRPYLGSLGEVIASGSQSVHVSEKVINISHFVVTKPRTVEGRTNDIIEMVSPDPVDSWREQLAR